MDQQEKIVVTGDRFSCPVCQGRFFGNDAEAVAAHKEAGLGIWICPSYGNGQLVGETERAHKDGYQGRYQPKS